LAISAVLNVSNLISVNARRRHRGASARTVPCARRGRFGEIGNSTATPKTTGPRSDARLRQHGRRPTVSNVHPRDRRTDRLPCARIAATRWRGGADHASPAQHVIGSAAEAQCADCSSQLLEELPPYSLRTATTN